MEDHFVYICKRVVFFFKKQILFFIIKRKLKQFGAREIEVFIEHEDKDTFDIEIGFSFLLKENADIKGLQTYLQKQFGQKVEISKVGENIEEDSDGDSNN